MKNMIHLSTLREIKGSFSRWIAILAICALGVGFFCGLKVCRQCFTTTGDSFLSNHDFFDYQLISTLGFEEKDLSQFQELKGVKNVQGSYSTDALVTMNTPDFGEKVMKFHTLTDNLNTPALEVGRLPASGDECIGDARYFTKNDLGKKIKISKGNQKATLNLFAYGEYTLVGLAESPFYLNYERGSTSLGDGSVCAFAYLPEDGWDSEYFTEIYLTLKSGGTIFSQEYEQSVASMEAILTTTLDAIANDRYHRLLSDADKKLSNARTQLKEGKQELKDAKIQLTDAERKIENEEQELAQKEVELLDAKAALEDKESQLNAALQQVSSDPVTAQDLSSASQMGAALQYEQAQNEIKSRRVEIELGFSKIEEEKKELESAKETLKKNRLTYEDGIKELKEAEKKISDAEEEIAILQPPKTYVLDRNTNIGYVCFDNDTNIVNAIAKVFPFFFLLVAALVCMTTMTRMIDDQRTQIGVLKAMGYGRRSILEKYIFYSGSASCLGGIIGFFIGIYLFPFVIWEAYKMMYDFSDLIYVIDWKLGAVAVFAAVLCCVGTTIFCCSGELFHVPAQLIRPKTPALGKRILLERIPFIWNRLQFLHKVCLRNIFRYKKRFFMMLLGICGCTALLLTGLGIGDSIKNVVSNQYDKIFYIDYNVNFDQDLDSIKQEQFLMENQSLIQQAMFVRTLSVDARVDGTIKSINMIVADPSVSIENFIDLHHKDQPIKYPGLDKCVINSNLGHTLGLKVGDSITVYDSDLREMHLEITALCDNYVNNYIYISRQTFQKQWGEAGMNAAFILSKSIESADEASIHEMGAQLMDSEYVSSVSITQDFRNRINQMMESLNYVILLVVACAGALAFIVLYNLTNINITERIREIATIQVLGFYPKETSAYVFRENIVLTGISALIGLMAGKLLHQFVMAQVKIDLLSFDVHIEPLSYFLSVAITFLFAFIVNQVMHKKLQKINMAESLKSIE